MAASGYRFGNGSSRRELQSRSPLHPKLPLMLETVVESTSKAGLTLGWPGRWEVSAVQGEVMVS